MLSTLIDPAIAAKNAIAVAAFNTYVDDWYPHQVHVRELLDATALPLMLYPAFEAFAGEMFHMSKTCSGTALVFNAQYLVLKYADPAMTGGNLPLLKAIALEFGALVP